MNKIESADLLMKLYDLRREEKMRAARNWMVGFMPESGEDILKALVNPETSAHFRMVTSYWDMAASFVNHGAIDEEMFLDVNGEGVMVFSKIEPFINELRQTMGSEKYLHHLETLIMKIPNAKEVLASRREMIRRMLSMRAEMAKNA